MSNKEVICVPGQRLCLADDNTLTGQGTYEKSGYIYAMLAGVVQIREENKMKYIDVKSFGKQTIVPMTGDVITAKITVVNQRFAKCLILCVRDITLTHFYRGIIRREDVRATDKDRIEMYKSFRPGDIVLAKVMPQVELNCYQLTTAENELGVVVATAKEVANTCGTAMIPVSWTEMQCPVSLVKEARKVAKILPESACTG